MTHKKRIQIVEDEAVIAMEMTQQLQGFGFDVVGTAANGDRAMALAAESRPDLIMMDVQIKGPVDGIETARRIRERLDVPVLFMTAHGDEATLMRAMETAPYGYLIKPYRPDELRATVKIVLDKHETEIQLRRYQEHLERLVRERTVELEHANAVKSAFLSSMSHELRTPMNAVLGFSQLLERGPLNENQLMYVQHIRQAGDHLLRLIEDLFDLKGIEAGRMTVDLQPVALVDVLAYAERLVKHLLAKKEVSLEVDSSTQATVTADPTRLGQVLVKLMSNAINYNRQSGSVAVTVDDAAPDRVRISVRDTGPGIAMADQARLFRPFDRLGATYTGIDGAGIGLTLSKCLVELMHGEIGFESGPGQGAVFWVTLKKYPAAGAR